MSASLTSDASVPINARVSADCPISSSPGVVRPTLGRILKIGLALAWEH
jgi:hypothetical protein